MLSKSELESSVVTRMRFLLSVFVVMIHIFPSEYCHGLSQVVYVFFAQGICRVAVPMFFIVSGYYFFKGFDGKWDWHLYGSKLKTRIQTLIIPYLLWNLLFFVLLAVRHRGGIDGLRELYIDCDGLLGIFWSGKNPAPLDFPLWFVRDLMCIIIISPILFFILRNKIAIVLLFISLMVYKYKGLNIVGLSYSALFFFSLGGGH